MFHVNQHNMYEFSSFTSFTLQHNLQIIQSYLCTGSDEVIRYVKRITVQISTKEMIINLTIVVDVLDYSVKH